MGALAHELKSMLAPKGVFLLRFLSRKRCVLPEDYQRFLDVLGSRHYCAGKKEGIALLTPLRSGYQGTSLQPLQTVFAVAAQNADTLHEYEAFVLGTFGKK